MGIYVTIHTSTGIRAEEVDFHERNGRVTQFVLGDQVVFEQSSTNISKVVMAHYPKGAWDID